MACEFIAKIRVDDNTLIITVIPHGALQNILIFIPCDWGINTSDRNKLQGELIRIKELFAWNNK